MKKNIIGATKKQVTYNCRPRMIYSYLYTFNYNKFYIEIWDKQGFILKAAGRNTRILFAQVRKRFALDITDFGYNY